MLHEKWKGPVAGWATEPDGIFKLERSSHNADREQEQVANDLARARAHLERRAETNRIVASWMDCLRQRIERANLRAELVGITEQEHDALVHEVSEYKRLCAALGWSPSGRRRS